MTGFVYKWTNTINGKWYIGSHKGTTDDGYRHSSKYLGAAEKKYGQENFTREILFEGNYVDDQIKAKEAAYLTKYNAAHNSRSYNQTNITGPNSLSAEARKKIGKATSSRPGWNKGTKTGPQSEEHKRKRSEAMSGRKQSSEHIRNQSEARRGLKRGPHTEETKQKIRESISGRTHTKETKQKIRTARLGQTPWNKNKPVGSQEIITCIHCNKSGGKSNMKRHHFDNCKDNNKT